MDKHLFKFLYYLISYHPEEFGLIPDNNGFFRIKEIFQVLNFTKKFKNVKINDLISIFSYYYKDFFEFSENLKLIKSKNPKHPQIIKTNLSDVKKFNTLWSFVKPKIWLKISIEGEWKPVNKKIVLYANKEIAENWAKVYGAIVIQVFPHKFPEGLELLKFGEEIFIVDRLPFEAMKGPPIDQKFLKKYNIKTASSSVSVASEPVSKAHFAGYDTYENEDIEEDMPFRKITKGKKKRKAWKKYQKLLEKEKWNF